MSESKSERDKSEQEKSETLVPVFKKVAEVKEKDADGGPSDIVSFAMVQMLEGTPTLVWGTYDAKICMKNLNIE